MDTPPASLVAASLAAAALLAPASPARAIGGYPAEAIHSAALHMHGSMSEQFGSWEWHLWNADHAGVDVVWWTDHDWRLTNWRHQTQYDFESMWWWAAGNRWVEPDDAFAGADRFWVPEIYPSTFLFTSISDTLAYEGNRSMRLEATGTPGSPDFEGEYYGQVSEELHNMNSLAKRVRLQFAVFPENLDPAETKFVVRAELSDHPEGTHILRYVLGDMEGEGAHSMPLAFTPGTWNTYEVDITADAIANFTTGGADSVRAEDNVLGLVSIGLETQNGADAVVFFDDYHIVVDQSLQGPALLDRGREAGAYYKTVYPSVDSYFGTEISRWKAQPHLNGYTPNGTMVDYTGYGYADTLYYAIDQIHDQGGAVSLNHFMGTFYVARDSLSQESWLSFSKTQLLLTRALGVDMLETGYRSRGGMELRHHLSLWDTALANGIWVTGTGVTDSHGRGQHQLDGWGPSEWGTPFLNNFVTWFFTETFDETGFLRAMKSGRAVFGDPYRWNGSMDMATADGFRMGQVVWTDRDSHDLSIEITDVPPGARIHLKQGEVRDNQGTSYPNVNWLRDEELTGSVVGGVFTDTVTLDTTVPSFARLELRNSADDEMAFSNPVAFVRQIPTHGIPPEKTAMRLGEVRLFRAEGFHLTEATLDGEPTLTLQGDADAPGTGMLQIDPGLLGAPSAVAGADAWNFTGGTLTLQGFSGAGATVEVTWSATSAPALSGAPDALALGAGRPNPFGSGTVFEYTIPREAWVRLDVIDTAGRRVRTLEAGFRKEGRHRAEWDGRDEGGVPVASGVYHLRLEHDGEVLVRKTVRLR
jgi:FlgD Ig-like domain